MRGLDYRKVSTERIRKSLGAERTFDIDYSDKEALTLQLGMISRVVATRLKKKNFRGRTLTVKIKYFDFEIHTRSKTFKDYVIDQQDILNKSMDLLFSPKLEKPVRLLGITVSKSDKQPEVEDNNQITLQLQ